MFKQFTKLGAKPKEGALDSDEEFEKIREEKERGRREEAERRDHRTIGQALNLFSIQARRFTTRFCKGLLERIGRLFGEYCKRKIDALNSLSCENV